MTIEAREFWQLVGAQVETYGANYFLVFGPDGKTPVGKLVTAGDVGADPAGTAELLIDALNLDPRLDGKSDIGHRHELGEIDGFQELADSKADLIDGTIPSSQLPALVKTDVFVVNSQSAMLALTAQSGDLAIRTDLTKTFVHNGGTAGTVSDWSELVSPTDAVTSVNGLIGSIVLGYADVGAAAAVHNHTLSQITDAAAAINAKFDKTGGELSGNTSIRHAGGGNSGPGTSWGPASNPAHGLEARWISPGQSRVQVTGPTGCNLDFEAVPLDGNGFANIRFNRTLNTTGSMAVQVFAGDGTSTVVGQISKGNSYFGITGNVGVNTNAPTEKLDVNGKTRFRGVARLAPYTVATLPNPALDLGGKCFAVDGKKPAGSPGLAVGVEVCSDGAKWLINDFTEVTA